MFLDMESIPTNCWKMTALWGTIISPMEDGTLSGRTKSCSLVGSTEYETKGREDCGGSFQFVPRKNRQINVNWLQLQVASRTFCDNARPIHDSRLMNQTGLDRVGTHVHITEYRYIRKAEQVRCL